MLVITNKTEARLLQDLREAVKNTPLQKCFYMNFSSVEVPKQELQETFLRTLDELPNAYMAQVYICHDYDIFILMQGFMQQQFKDFVVRLGQELGQDSFLDLIEILEVGVDWKTLENLCATKIQAANEVEENAAIEDLAKEQDSAVTQAMSELDANAIAGLSKRRFLRSGCAIMVVDDDQLSRTLVGNVLDKGFHMVYARNGQEALKFYVENAPDVLFLDIGLPDIDGHKLLEVLSQIDPDGYIIMFSGRKDKENMLRALRAGAQGFVGKPFTRNELMHYIEKSPFWQEKQDREGNASQVAVK